MNDHHLIISNPPQPAGNLSGVAGLFGLTAAEVRMKANFPGPEIWFADENFEQLTATAASLEEAGLNVVLARSSDLRAVPDRTIAKSFTFHEDGLELLADETTSRIPYDAPVIIVRCEPRRAASLEGLQRGSSALRSRLSQSSAMGSGEGRRSSMVHMLAQHEVGSGHARFLDFYISSGTDRLRFAVIENIVDFSGLHIKLPRATDNMVMFFAECSDRFAEMEIDERLVGLLFRTPLRLAPHNPKTGRRSGFSMATPKLSQLLKQVAPALDELDQADLWSRLVYLTRRLEPT